MQCMLTLHFAPTLDRLQTCAKLVVVMLTAKNTSDTVCLKEGSVHQYLPAQPVMAEQCHYTKYTVL